MNDIQDEEMDKESRHQWWIAAIGDTMVWARLEILDSGIAEVFDSSGELLRYDDEETARTALLDAEFRAFDGLDEDDAAILGFDLDEVEPPYGHTDDDMLPMMVQKLPSRH